MIHPQAWENERRIVEIIPPIPVIEWAQKTDWETERLEMLPYDSLIEEGRYAGGHVLMLHAEGTTQLRAVTLEFLPLLEGMLPDGQYGKLMERTPKLARLASKPSRAPVETARSDENDRLVPVEYLLELIYDRLRPVLRPYLQRA